MVVGRRSNVGTLTTANMKRVPLRRILPLVSVTLTVAQRVQTPAPVRRRGGGGQGRRRGGLARGRRGGMARLNRN